MRRTIAAASVALATVLAVLPATGSAADEPTGSVPPSTSAAPAAPVDPVQDGIVTPEMARATLDQATDVLGEQSGGEQSGAAQEVPVAEEPEATLLMRDLFVALPALEGTDRTRAESLLARPSDGAQDPAGNGYSVGSRKKCSSNLCLHYVTSTADAPPSMDWVNRNLKVLKKVWRAEVKNRGYRAPVRDGGRGGNGKFDVYLKELGGQNIYGYCTPEYRKVGTKGVASGYCVLDNDFAASQFGGAAPLHSLKVTAAHEFFHAIQFGYDYLEDRWMMESTATWMEEQVYDGVNDNRQYLRYGQVATPSTPLDAYRPGAFYQYGNWTFWEYLSKRFGRGVVKSAWNRAGSFRGAPDHYSIQAVRKAIGGRGGGLARVYAAYAAANVAPARNYREGSAWPKAAVTSRVTLAKSDRRAKVKTRVDHLAARNITLAPNANLRGKKWKLRIKVAGPSRSSSPVVMVTVQNKKGGWGTRRIALNGKGNGKMLVPFSAKRVGGITVTVVNASTRYRCSRGTNLACHGKARDNGKKFVVRAVAVKKR